MNDPRWAAVAMIPFALALLVATTAPAAAEVAGDPRTPLETERLDALADFVFEGLAAEPIGCPEEARELLRHDQHARCATLEMKASKFRRSWRRLMKEPTAAEMEPKQRDWLAGTLWMNRSYLLGAAGVRVWFSERNRGLILAFGPAVPMCEQPTEEELALRSFHGEIRDRDRLTNPRLIRESKVEPRPTALARKLPSVEVDLKAKIDEEGRTTVLCVLSEWPRGTGFAQEAIRAVEQWRYEPATLDGEPVAVSYTVRVWMETQ